jgi:hypothetical protein
MSVQNTRSESAPSDAPQTSSIYRPTPSLADLITGVPFVSSRIASALVVEIC